MSDVPAAGSEEERRRIIASTKRWAPPGATEEEIQRVARSRSALLAEARASGRPSWPPLASGDCGECDAFGGESPHELDCSIGIAERKAILARACVSR
jgi:hypothetical protein